MRRVLMLTGVLMLVLVGLLAVVRQQEPLPQWIYFLREDQLHRVAWDGTHESDLRLSSIHSINLSRDAQWIMWIDNVDQDLHLTSIDLADSRIIATNFNLASWSLDSKNIATISHNDLTIYDIVSNKWHSLSIPDVYVFAYSWSSNSEWILFAGTRNGSVRLFRTRTDSTGFQTYDVSGFMPLWWQIRLAWSPDDQYIAFSIKYEEEAADVYVMQADGTHLQNLTNTGDVDESVAQWSLDGHSIYFTNEYGELFRLQTDGKKVQVEVDAPVFPRPGLELEKDWIVYHDFISISTSRLYRYNIKTGEKFQLTEGTGYERDAQVTPPIDLSWHAGILTFGATLLFSVVGITDSIHKRMT